MNSDIEMLIMDFCVCNDMSYRVLDLSSFSNLKGFQVGDYSFSWVEEVKLIGLNRLERVVIGKECFVIDNDWRTSSNRYLCLRNCERVKELKIGCLSFFDYDVCEIENVPSLEVIEMGGLNERSINFSYASLELRSDCERME